MKRIVLLAGARPNYMKIFPIWRELSQRTGDVEPVIVHTGQHYDRLMSDAFFIDLGLPKPDHFLGVGSGPHGRQTGKTMLALEPILEEVRPDLLVVVGDVNSTVAGALVGVKLGIPVAHVEAGLRSGDRTMPEEINRIATDAICDLLLTSCPDGEANLLREGVDPARIHFVGNVMIDSLMHVLPRTRESDVLAGVGLTPQSYVAVTLHRPANVDDGPRLQRILDALASVAESRPVVFPMHPRTRKMVDQLGLGEAASKLQLLDPLGYMDFLSLMSQAALVITDSGGIQEETTFLGIPCLTVRPNTERPITVSEGTNRLVEPGDGELASAARGILSAPMPGRPTITYWDGRAGARAVDVLTRFLGIPAAG